MCLPLLLLPAGAALAGTAGAATAGTVAVGAGVAAGAAGAAAAAATAGAVAGSAVAASAGILGTGITAAQIGLVGSLLSAGSALAAGQAQKQAGKTNEKLAKRDAIVSATATALQQADITKRNRALVASQVVAGAKSGRTFSGSLLDVAAGSQAENELDILASAYGGGVSAARFKGDANIARASGKGALKTAAFSAGTTLLGGAAKFGAS